MKPSSIALGAGGLLLFLLALSGKKKTPEIPPVPSVGGGVAGVARGELLRWAGLTETSPAAEPLLRTYWAAAGQAYPGPGTAWSGAFVSWVVSQALPGALTPSGAHIYYARRAYLDRGVPGRYGAYRPMEVRVEPGDVLLRGRDEPLAFSDLTQTTRDFIPTHADIVTEIFGNEARIVGGNVDNAVSERSVPLNGGVVADPAVVAVLKYQPGQRMV